MSCPIKNSIAECEDIYQALDQLVKLLPERTVEISDLLNGIGSCVEAIERNLDEL